MRILLVQETDWILRGPHQQHHLMERMVQRGHEVRVIDYNYMWRKIDGNKELLSNGFIRDIPGKVIEKSKIKLIRPMSIQIPLLDKLMILPIYSRLIQNQIDLFNPDIIIGLGLLTVYSAQRKAVNNGIPFIFYSIDKNYTLVPSLFQRPFAKFIEKINLLNADGILTINNGLRNFAIRMGCESEKTKVISGGVDFKKYNYTGNRKTIRGKFGFEDNDVVLFFMGWIYDFSGMKEVVLELVKNQHRNPNIKLFIVGEGDLYNELKYIKEKYNLNDRIILTGKQPFERIPEFLSVSDICLLPAYNNNIMREIVPIKMYEYMAASKPVIASRLPGLIGEFGDDNGVIYIDKSEDTLMKTIDLIERGVIQDEGIKARKFVEKYKWSNIVDEFEKYLNEVILNG